MDVNIELLKKFEKTVDTIHPERGQIPIKILGYGEISLVFQILEDPLNLAYKRIPIFNNEKEVRRHVWAYDEYCRFLENEIGFTLPKHGTVWFKDEKGEIKFYCIQKIANPEAVGNQVIHNVNDDKIETLIILIMREMKKVWDFNRNNDDIDLGLDGQISNFVIADYNANSPEVNKNSKLIYLDTSTPLFRKEGVEAMEAELLLRSAPSFLRFILKALFVQEVLDRYYDWRLVTIDLIANFFKEQKPEIIPRLIKKVNQFFQEEAKEFEIEPITLEEVQKYYKNDKTIWSVFQRARKIDRFIKTKLFNKKYDFYLPGKIER